MWLQSQESNLLSLRLWAVNGFPFHPTAILLNVIRTATTCSETEYLYSQPYPRGCRFPTPFSASESFNLLTNSWLILAHQQTKYCLVRNIPTVGWPGTFVQPTLFSHHRYWLPPRSSLTLSWSFSIQRSHYASLFSPILSWEIANERVMHQTFVYGTGKFLNFGLPLLTAYKLT